MAWQVHSRGFGLSVWSGTRQEPLISYGHGEAKYPNTREWLHSLRKAGSMKYARLYEVTEGLTDGWFAWLPKDGITDYGAMARAAEKAFLEEHEAEADAYREAMLDFGNAFKAFGAKFMEARRCPTCGQPGDLSA